MNTSIHKQVFGALFLFIINMLILLQSVILNKHSCSQWHSYDTFVHVLHNFPVWFLPLTKAAAVQWVGRISRDIKIGIQIGSDWPQNGTNLGLLRSVSVYFGSVSQNVLNLILKSPTCFSKRPILTSLFTISFSYSNTSSYLFQWRLNKRVIPS